MNRKKELGQYFTPDEAVTMVLDAVGYAGDIILSKTIMEPSFGDGAFLENIARRIIQAGKSKHLNHTEIGALLDDHIYGIEKDSVLYEQAIARLNTLLVQEGLSPIQWKHLICADALTVYSQFIGQMDFVVGNPPFIRVHHIDSTYRSAVKDFTFSKGMIDLYIVFYEMGIAMLNKAGRLGYISSNSFLKNSSQKCFRNYLAKENLLSAIYDFKDSKIFPDAQTYTCICVIDTQKHEKNTKYKAYSMYDLTTEVSVQNSYLEDTADLGWTFGTQADIAFLEDIASRTKKIEACAIVQNGIATNRDSLYVGSVFRDETMQDPYTEREAISSLIVYMEREGRPTPIESSILRRCVKASTFTGEITNTYIIFPYIKTENRYRPYSEPELKAKFPLAYQYLSSIKEELCLRKMDPNAQWFEYARNQGLTNCDKEKIVLSHILNRNAARVTPYYIDKDVVVYSGIYITGDENLALIHETLSSAEFARYCLLTGKDMSGGYISFSANTIKKFGIL